MDLDELRAFLAVVESGSLSSASVALMASRATLRRRVDALEARVGATLLERTVDGFELTPAGRLLADRGRALVRDAEHLNEALRDAAAAPQGRVVAALPPGSPPFVMAPALSMWRATFPDVRFDVLTSEDPLAELLDSADVAVVYGPVPDDGPWFSMPIRTVRVWLVASDAYLARRGVPQTPAELAGHELLVWRHSSFDPCVLPTAMGPLQVQPGVISADVHGLRYTAMSGLGIAYLPDALLPDPGADAKALRPVLPDLVGGEVTVSVVFSKARARNPEMRAVVKHLVPFLEQAIAGLG